MTGPEINKIKDYPSQFMVTQKHFFVRGYQKTYLATCDEGSGPTTTSLTPSEDATGITGLWQPSVHSDVAF